MIVKTQLSTYMEEERIARGLTKGKISEAIGISVGQYSAYVTGKSMPRTKTLEKIAGAYGKSMDEIRAMLSPIASASTQERAYAASAAEPDGSLLARIKFLEAKLDYAVQLIEQITRA